LSYGEGLRPAREQLNLSHPGASVYGPVHHPGYLIRCGGSDYSLTLVGDGPTTPWVREALNVAWMKPSKVGLANKAVLDLSKSIVSTNLTKVLLPSLAMITPSLQRGTDQRGCVLRWKSPAYTIRSESDSDISLHDVDMDES
jgi:hypothetical protein